MRSQLRSDARLRPRRVISKSRTAGYGRRVSSGRYRFTRPTGAPPPDGAPGARVEPTASSSALPLPPLPDEDLALTRAPTEPLPAELVAQIATRAVGTDPPPVRTRLPAPSAPSHAPRLGTSPPSEPPAARMVSFGTTTLLLVPAGDRIALVIPGVVRVTGTREEAAALAEALVAPPKR